MTSPPPRRPHRLGFLEAVTRGRLVGDGAMGTELLARGVPLTTCFESLDVTRPELVAAIHRAHLEAGADVIETNTFGANPTRLAQHGLADRAEALDLAGARIAREVAGDAWVVGSIGPTGLVFPRDSSPISSRERARLGDDFRRQAEALALGGVDAIVVETMRDPRELLLALEFARGVGLPVVALATFDDTREGSRMADGTDPATIARRLVDHGAAVVGANCGTGPRQLVEVARGMLAVARTSAVPTAMFPSAGLPRRVDAELVYPATPEDVASAARELFEMGVSWVGGCCGTDRTHVAAVARARSSLE